MTKLTKMKNALGLLFVAIFTLIISSCEKDFPNGITDKDALILNEHFKAYEIVTVDEAAILSEHQNRMNFIFDMKLENHPNWKFDLDEYNIDAEDFQMYLVGEGGTLTPFEAKSYSYSGYTTKGNDQAIFIFEDNKFSGNIFENDAEYFIEPLREYIPNATKNQYLVYDVKNSIDHENVGCDNHDAAAKYLTAPEQGEEIPLLRSGDYCYQVELSYLGDYQLYEDKFNYDKSSASSWMNGRVIYASYRYHKENDYHVSIIRKNGYIYTSNITVASKTSDYAEYLNQWKAFGNQNASWYNRGDINALFTGKDVANSSGNYGTTGAAAKPRTLCNLNDGSKAYLYMEKHSSKWRSSNLLAHECGHTMGASANNDHTSTGFMTSNYSESSMAQRTKDEITAYLTSRTGCLSVSLCD